MRRPAPFFGVTFFLAGLLFLAGVVPEAGAQALQVRSAEPVCELPKGAFEGRRIMAAPVAAKRQKSASFTINFLTTGDNVSGNACDPWPSDAQAAFQRAAATWEGLLESTVPIEVDACWTQDVGGNTLGSAGPLLVSGFPGQPEPNTFYPLALANALAGSDLLPDETEIMASFNANRTDWYFGESASGLPNNQLDFETVVLHELGHGLGFVGSATYNSSTDEGSLASNSNNYPYAYDHLVEDDAGAPVLSFTSPSTALGNLLTGGSESGGSGGLFFNGTQVSGANGGVAPLYAPSTWQGGSSYSHWNQNSYTDELMRPIVAYGQAIRDPQLALDLLEDIGWDQALPVELTSFEAVADGGAALLTWATASETNNAGFEVQHARPAANASVETGGPASSAWTTLTFVEGAGTTSNPQQYRFRAGDLAPGSHRFRLRQVDFDGASELSPVVEVALPMAAPYRLSSAYPNPAQGPARLDLMVERVQEVRAVLYDALGREVALLHEGRLQAQAPLALRVETAGLPSGLYLVRVEGTAFSATRRLTLVR